MRSIRWIATGLFMFALFVYLMSDPAHPHSSPLGMKYPSDCCDPEGLECGPVPAESVVEKRDGYHVTVMPGEHKNAHPGGSVRLFGHGEPGVRLSSDGMTHACLSPVDKSGDYVYGGDINCIIVPPKGF